MGDLIGRIRPTIDVSEPDGFDGPTRTIDYSDPAHGLCIRIQWRTGRLDNAVLRESAPLVSLVTAGIDVIHSADPPNASEGV